VLAFHGGILLRLAYYLRLRVVVNQGY
jgi:hypothetical protein